MDSIENILFDRGLLETLPYMIIFVFVTYKLYKLIKYRESSRTEVKAKLILKDTSVYNHISLYGIAHSGLNYKLKLKLKSGEEELVFVSKAIWDDMIEGDEVILIYIFNRFINLKKID